MPPLRFLVPALLAVAVAGAAAGGLLLASSRPRDPAGQGSTSGTPQIGGPFRLTTQDGSALSDGDLHGRPFAVFFGFTNCPDVCPTTLWEMSEALRKLGDEASDLRVLFVTVDPQRDTAKALKQYLQSFDPRIVGLTGTPDEIARVAKSYRVFFEKVPGNGDDYSVNHTAVVYLMDRAGKLADVSTYQEPEDRRLAKLRKLIADRS